MEKLAVTVPDMWADHHVLKARKALAALPGVTAVAASARDLELVVTHDAAVTPREIVVETLIAAGYPPGGPPVPPGQEKDKPAWATAPRVTATDAADLAMSGDYRQY